MPRKERGVQRGRRKALPFHPDAVRAKIRAMRMVDLLHQHIEGTRELSSSQIRACEILLRKVVPDLTSTTVSGEVNVKYVVHLPEPISREAWLAKYAGDYLNNNPQPLIEGTTNGSGEPHTES